MIGRVRHLRDERLLECYRSVRTNEPLDPRLAEHLTDCGSCATKYAELATFMDALAVQADAETNAVFTADHLRAQQREIARRIEHVGRPARVISFPRQFAGEHGRPAPTRHAHSRWMAGAAAAGLFMGVALGVTFEWERHGRPTNALASVRPPVAPGRLATASPASAEVSAPATGVTSDDSFLSELDVALERPRFGGELQIFDALTPHVREIRNTR